jgi:hypothetical protein
MFACYRRDEATDPEIYCAAIASILGDGYSLEVVEYVTDPRTGLPSTQKFLPTVAEVRSACDARASYLDRVNRYSKLKPAPRKEITKRPGEIDAAEFDRRVALGELKSRPIGRFEVAP